MDYDLTSLMQVDAVEPASGEEVLREFGYTPRAHRICLASAEDVAASRYRGVLTNQTMTTAPCPASLAAELEDGTMIETAYHSDSFEEEREERAQRVLEECMISDSDDRLIEALSDFVDHSEDAYQLDGELTEVPQVRHEQRNIAVDASHLKAFATEVVDLLDEYVSVEAVSYALNGSGVDADRPEQNLAAVERTLNDAYLVFRREKNTTGGEVMLRNSEPYWNVSIGSREQDKDIAARLADSELGPSQAHP